MFERQDRTLPVQMAQSRPSQSEPLCLLSSLSLRINPVIHIDAANSNGTIPQSIPGLKRLELFFRDPYTSDASFLSNGVLATGSSTIGS
jgi:hypothetical protein